jgi:hypothetical protein
LLVALVSQNALAAGLPPVQTVFVLMLENKNWSEIQTNHAAPYINQILLPAASYCGQYYNPPGLHPSLPNYLWLEAGTNFGIFDDYEPLINHLNTTNHLTAQLNATGISWKAYQEDIAGTNVPLENFGLYGVRHNPFVYFDDVTGTNDPNNAYGIAHIRPYSELATDLASNTVARFNFITPNTCHDMHDCDIATGDAWLSNEVPKILNSPAYQNGGALFIIWDEAAPGSDGPIGMVLLSPLGRGGGFCSSLHFTHSSTLRTIQEIFGVGPWLGDAANTLDLGDLFAQPAPGYGFSGVTRLPDGTIELTLADLVPGRTNRIDASIDLANWTAISTNCALTNWMMFTDLAATNFAGRFYRLVLLP